MRLSLFILLVAASSVPTLAYAASGGHGQEHSIGELWYHFVNFSIYVLLLYLLLRSSVATAWQKRRDTISASLAKGTSILTDANRELKEAESKMASVNSDIETIKKQMTKETDDEVSLILQDAEKRASDIIKRGEESASAEKKIVERLIREELSRSVLARAQEILSKKTSIESDKARREASLRNISQIVQ